MFVSLIELTRIVTVLVSAGLSLAEGQVYGESDNCQLQESTVPITRHVSISHGGRSLTVTCARDVKLSKCEGMCESSVSPSVRIQQGFKKDCRCCKETSSEPREVTLTCYKNGQEIADFQHPVAVKDITGCSCQQCTG